LNITPAVIPHQPGEMRFLSGAVPLDGDLAH
jgi:hypothetical protein